MPKRARGTLLPLHADPAAASLRAQIYTTCVSAMQDGRLTPGARLPSARQLAADWRVARNTVDDAIAQLQAEGFVVRRVGAGTFVSAASQVLGVKSSLAPRACWQVADCSPLVAQIFCCQALQGPLLPAAAGADSERSLALA